MIAEPPSGSHLDRDPGMPGGIAGWEAEPEPLVRLASGIAHDFNNLLTVINGYSEMILESAPDPECCRGYVRQILDAGTKAAEIVELILAYAGASCETCEVFDVNRMLEDLRGFLIPCLGEAIRLELRLCGEPAPINGERGRFQWALMHLAMNAREAMPGGGRLVLATRVMPQGETGGFGLDAHAPRLEFSMRDTGCGMAKSDLARVFQPYFSTKKKSNEHGTGLGLACVQGIVRRLGGCIVAESEPGLGSVFRICLPLAEEARR